MEVYSTDGPRDLVEADVIKSFKASAIDARHSMIRYKEVFFPSHEQVFSVRVILVAKVWLPGLSS